MSINERTCFPFYYNFLNQFRLLTPEDRGTLIMAIIEYAMEQRTSISLSPLVEMAFSSMKPFLDKDREKYIATCEKNSENGKKGGRPRKNIFSEKTERFSEETEKGDKERDRDKDKEMDKDKDNDNDLDRGEEKEKKKEKESDCADSVFPPSAPRPFPQGSASKREKENNSISFQEPPAHFLSDEQRKRLISSGLPSEYISAREERVSNIAQSTKRSAFSIFLEWWEKDKHEAKWRKADGSDADELDAPMKKSYDLDEFFKAAVRRSYAELDSKYSFDDEDFE